MYYEDLIPRGRRHRASPWLGIAAFIAAAIVFAWAAWNILDITAEDAANLNTIESMQRYVTLKSVPAEAHGRSESESMSAVSDATEISGLYQAQTAAGVLEVDMNGLTHVNPDVRGWIRIPGTNISHAVVQGQDNDWYLHHGPDRSANRAGAIFMDAGNDGSFQQQNTVLFGHRMNNGTMFAELHKFEDAAFRRSTPYIFVVWPDGSEHP